MKTKKPGWTQLARTMLRRIVTTTMLMPDDDPDDGSDIEALWAASLADRNISEPDQAPTSPAPALSARDVRWIEPDRALMIARLALTFGTARSIGATAVDGAITILQADSNDEANLIGYLLRHAAFGDDVLVSSSLNPDARGKTVHLTTLLSPDSGASDANFKSGLTRIADSLQLRSAVLVVVADANTLPASMRASLPPPIVLAPLTKEVVLFAIEAMHQVSDRPAVLAQLPSPRALARLGRLEFAVAFRATHALGVAEALRKHCEPRPRGSLAALTGTGELFETATRLVADLLAFADGTLPWSDIPRGLLLVGPPGTGKTHAARVIAEAAGLPTVMATVGEWQAAGHLGEMLRSMRATFAEARRLAPCVLVIDEIDSIGSRTEPSDRNRNYTRQVVNEMLAQLDGLAGLEGVMLIGATNHPEHIDPAVLRAGRLDLHVPVPLPGPEALAQILRVQLGSDAPADLNPLVRAARGRTPAAISGVVRQARSRARAAGRALGVQDLLCAFGDLDLRHPDLRWRIAVHEAGHAIIAHVLGLGEITDLSLTGDGGEAKMLRAPTAGLHGDYEDQIAHALGGRAAEIVVFGAPSGGSGGSAESDLAIATHLALGLERCVGLGQNGLIWEAVEGIAARPISAGERAAVSKRLDEQCARAVRLLARHRVHLERLARRLAEMGHLVTAEIGEFLPEVDDAAIVANLAHPRSETYDS